LPVADESRRQAGRQCYAREIARGGYGFRDKDDFAPAGQGWHRLTPDGEFGAQCARGRGPCRAGSGRGICRTDSEKSGTASLSRAKRHPPGGLRGSWMVGSDRRRFVPRVVFTGSTTSARFRNAANFTVTRTQRCAQHFRWVGAMRQAEPLQLPLMEPSAKLHRNGIGTDCGDRSVSAMAGVAQAR